MIEPPIQHIPGLLKGDDPDLARGLAILTRPQVFDDYLPMLSRHDLDILLERALRNPEERIHYPAARLLSSLISYPQGISALNDRNLPVEVVLNALCQSIHASVRRELGQHLLACRARPRVLADLINDHDESVSGDLLLTLAVFVRGDIEVPPGYGDALAYADFVEQTQIVAAIWGVFDNEGSSLDLCATAARVLARIALVRGNADTFVTLLDHPRQEVRLEAVELLEVQAIEGRTSKLLAETIPLLKEQLKVPMILQRGNAALTLLHLSALEDYDHRSLHAAVLGWADSPIERSPLLLNALLQHHRRDLNHIALEAAMELANIPQAETLLTDPAVIIGLASRALRDDHLLGHLADELESRIQSLARKHADRTRSGWIVR